MRSRRHRVRVLLVGLLVGCAGLPLTAGAAAAATDVDQSYWVPVGRTLTMDGHGFGHGHGMSQYGAEGAAHQGLTYQQIVGFYYPGTTWSTVTGPIRVLVSADTTDDVVVLRTAGMTVRDLGSGTTYPLPAISGVTRWRIAVGAGGRSVVDYLTGAWHRWQPGGHAALAGDGEFAAPTPLTLVTPTGDRAYRGALRSVSSTPGSSSRETVDVVSMDDYVRGVIAAEMPASWLPEAVRAQAVATRTYAAWSRAQNPNGAYQICDTSSCQVYRGVSAEDPRSDAAVTATATRILTYGGQPAFTQFGASDGGWTSAGSRSYLVARADPYDGFAGNPLHSWTRTLSASSVEGAYPSIGTLRRIQVTRREGGGQWGGRVQTLVLDGTRGDVTVSGDTFAYRFGLRTPWFAFEPTAIVARWTALGGDRSPLGGVLTREHTIPGGVVQVFEHGRIWSSPSAGVHELYGPVFTAFRARGGVVSALGYPTTGVRVVTGGRAATFQHGTITWDRSSGVTTVAVG